MRIRIKTLARLAFTAALAVIGLWVARSFLIPLGWASVLAIAFWPLYRRCTEHGRFNSGSALAPLVFTLLIGLVLLIPLGFAAVEVGRAGQAASEWVHRSQEAGIPNFRRVPALNSDPTFIRALAEIVESEI